MVMTNSEAGGWENASVIGKQRLLVSCGWDNRLNDAQLARRPLLNDILGVARIRTGGASSNGRVLCQHDSLWACTGRISGRLERPGGVCVTHRSPLHADSRRRVRFRVPGRNHQFLSRLVVPLPMPRPMPPFRADAHRPLLTRSPARSGVSALRLIVRPGSRISPQSHAKAASRDPKQWDRVVCPPYLLPLQSPGAVCVPECHPRPSARRHRPRVARRWRIRTDRANAARYRS
jgi:hypothetical protein